MIVNSNSITFMDTTDAKKIDVHISSNHPTVQIYNSNLNTYTPNWETNKLQLTATIYADSEDVTKYSTFKWVEIRGSDSTEHDLEFTGNPLEISRNSLSEYSIIRYKCYATYNSKSFSNEITLTRINDGVTAPTVMAQYSIDGSEGSWETVFNSATHKYIRFSYDGGHQWQEAIKIVGERGENGQSIALKGTAYTNDELVVGSAIKLYADETKENELNTDSLVSGDSYLVDGYLCVYNGTNFICTGQIQGPQGEKGDSYYLFIRYADDAGGGGISLYPEGKSYIGFYRSVINQVPSAVDYATWNWAKFVGEDAKSITLTANAQVFKINKNNEMTPQEIKITAQTENTSVASWSYIKDGETVFTDTRPPGVSLPEGNVITVTGSKMTSNYITIKASDNLGHSDVFTVYKVSDGADGEIGPDGKPASTVFLTNEHIPFVANADGQVELTTATCNVVGYNGITKITPIIGVITDLPQGMSITPNRGTAYAKSELAIGNVVMLYADKNTNTPINTENLNDGDTFVSGVYLCRYNKTNNNFICEDTIVSDNEIKLTITVADGSMLGSASSINRKFPISISEPVQTTLWLNWSKVNSGPKGDNAPAVQAQYSADGESNWTSSFNATTHKYVHFSYDNGETWSDSIKIAGEDAKSVTLNASTQVFKVDKSHTASPATITVTAQAINTTIPNSGWTYSIDGGKTFSTTVPTGVTRSENVITLTGSTLVENSIVIKASDGTYSDTLTIYKVSDGADGEVGASAPIAFLTNENVTFSANAQGQITGATVISNIVAYNGTTKVTPTIGTITGAPTGMAIAQSTINNEVRLTITIANNATLGSASSNMGTINIPIVSPINTTLYLNWSKVNTGAQGVQGPKGNDGQQYYTWVKYADTPTSGMSDNPDGKVYIGLAYNKTTATESNTYSDYMWSLIKGETGAIGPKGEDGQQYYTWIKYADNASGANMSDSPNGKSYIGLAYNKTTSTESNVASDYTWALFKGDKGADAYTVILTNESHIFAGNVSNAIASSATTQVMAYKGSASQSVTIVSVDGKAASTNSTATSIAGLSFSCSALSGTSPTITFTCTTSFVSPSGTIPIVLTVDGVTITKMFTYSIAFKGATGSQGSAGTAASLVDITPSALYFKSTTGKGGTFTPDYIYLYPRFQTVTYSKWEYSTNGGTSWTTVTSGSNGLTIGTYGSVNNSLQIAKTSALYTDTVTSISFRCVSSSAAVYDTVSVAKIYDVVDLQIGGRNYILNSANLSVSGLGSSNGSRMEYKYIDVGQSYMNIASGTEVTISFDLEMTVNTVNPTLLIYNSNRKGPKTIANKTLQFTAAVGETIKQRCSVTTILTDRTDATSTVNSIEFYSTYETYNWFKISNLKLEIGNKATDWSPAPEDLKSTTFQLYAPKGYLITNETSEVTLQTFAYDGSQAITNATFKWYSWNGETWGIISGATSTSLTINKASVMKTSVYKCEMTYGGKVYEATATVEDKTDIYDSLIRVSAKRTSNNSMYWILYTTVYSEEGERDALLGPVSETAPANPTTGAYWYQINPTDYSITLKKYSGTAWATSTDKQELSYDWFLFRDATDMVSLGDKDKVKIIKNGDFVTTCNVQCNVFDAENMVLSRNNQVLTDPTDPIVSDTEPSNPIDGQIWIQIGENNNYTLSIWSAELNRWILSDADTQNKVYVTKPVQYNEGDLWIVDSNYLPIAYENEVAQTFRHSEKTMLRAIATSQTYSDAHWVEALKYQKELDGVIGDMEKFKQFISIDDTGLTMQAKGANGAVSEFKTMLTNTELGFYQGAAKVAYINNNQLNIS